MHRVRIGRISVTSLLRFNWNLLSGGATYRFADPESCQCAYVGGSKEYAELQRLRAERVAERDWVLRRSSYGNTYSPIMWGAWDPEGLDIIRAPIAASDIRERSALK